MRIELDTVTDTGATAADTAQVIVADYPDVTFRVVTEHGPAGGNPIIRYRGPRDQVRQMIVKHYGEDTLEQLAD